MHQPNLDHPTHDLALVAAHAAGDLPESERHAAEAQLASCPDCAQLDADLLAIAAATHSVPAPFSRRRDFQLEPAVADRLRGGSWLRRLLRPFGAAGSPARPIAAAFTTLGLAGLLFAAILPGLAGGAATGAPTQDRSLGAGAAAAPGATAAPAAAENPYPVAAPTSKNEYGAGQFASIMPGATSVVLKGAPSASPIERSVAHLGSVATESPVFGTASGAGELAEAPQPNLLVMGSVALLLIGLALFGLRFAGRRVR